MKLLPRAWVYPSTLMAPGGAIKDIDLDRAHPSSLLGAIKDFEPSPGGSEVPLLVKKVLKYLDNSKIIRIFTK